MRIQSPKKRIMQKDRISENSSEVVFGECLGELSAFKNATPAHSLNRQYIQGATNAQNAQEFRFNMHLGGSFFLPEAVF